MKDEIRDALLDPFAPAFSAEQTEWLTTKLATVLERHVGDMDTRVDEASEESYDNGYLEGATDERERLRKAIEPMLDDIREALG